MTLSDFVLQLGENSQLDFEDTMAVINEHYAYTPTGFNNGDVRNEAGQNEGSCKVFAFARLNTLCADKTLACFGRFYQDVLANPNGDDHGNIRAFMKSGWTGITFDSPALAKK